MPSWKIAQSKKQTVQRTKLALFVLVIVMLILVLGQGLKFGNMLYSPWKINTTEKTSWNSDFSINLLVRSNSISLVNFNPTDKKITIVKIPDQTLVETVHGFGSWQVSSIYEFGQLQKGVGGDKLLKDSMSAFFGLPIEGIVEGDLVNMIIDKKLSLLSIFDLKSDLSLFDLLKLEMELSSVRFDRITQIDLLPSGGLEKSRLADGTEVLLPEYNLLDQAISELVDPVIASEHKTIAIFNSTEHPGLALTAARLISNLGGDVIIVSNSKEKFEETKISGEKSKTYQRIKQIFGANDTIDSNAEELVTSRAQINLFLGEDYFNKQ